jgi:hypothetical protein
MNGKPQDQAFSAIAQGPKTCYNNVKDSTNMIAYYY